MIRRQETASSATLAPARPPRLTKAARQAGSISKPATLNPRARKRSAIALPIRPKPINPIGSRAGASAAEAAGMVCRPSGDKGIPGSLVIAPQSEHTKTAVTHAASIRGTPLPDLIAPFQIQAGVLPRGFHFAVWAAAAAKRIPRIALLLACKRSVCRGLRDNSYFQGMVNLQVNSLFNDDLRPESREQSREITVSRGH